MIVNGIYDWARLQPAKAALICNGVMISYADFARAIEATRFFLAGKRLSPGRTAVVVADISSDAWVYALALRALGLDTVYLPIGWTDAARFRNVDCVIVGEAEFAAFKPPNGTQEDGAKIIVVPKSIYRNVRTGELPQSLEGHVPAGGHILFTSGTTGSYKMVLQDGANEEKRNVVRAREMLFDRDSIVHVLDLPLWTGAGFKQPSSVWHMGGSVAIDQGLDGATRCFDCRPTHVFAAPQTLKALVEDGCKRGSQVVRGTVFAIGGGFVPLHLAEQIAGPLESKLYVHYSATEAGSLIMRTEFRGKDDLSWYAPVAGRTIRIVNADGGDCALGEEGRLGVVLTDLDSAFYLDDDEATRNIFVDGMFLTGDIAVARADGRVRILGRGDDVVNIGGIKTSVAPIEQTIRDLLRVEDVCLFSGLNEAGEDEIVVALQSSRAIPRTELEPVANKFAFGRVRFFIHKKFPRAETGMGKVRRAELRQWVFNQKSPAHRAG